MENAYGVGITNRYALFIDDEEGGGDPLDILKQSENDRVKSKTDVKGKPSQVVAGKGPQGVKKDSRRDADNSDKENRGNSRFDGGKRMVDARKAQDGPREERNNRINQEGGPRRDFDDDSRGRGRGGGGPGRGRGRGRGDMRGRGEGAGRGGKREYDRKSGDNKTGIKPEEKRGGGGKGNWGTMEDEIEAKEVDESGANTSVDENTSRENAEEKIEDGEKEEAPKEDEPKQMTLDEWKAMQSKKEQPKFNLRKAGEGSDIDPKWKKAAAYKKEKEGPEEESEDEENYVYPQRANRQKHVLDIDFHFADQQQGGRGGGRGRGRGRGRGGDRGGRGGYERGGRGGYDRGGRGGGGGGGPREGGEGAPREGGAREGGPREGGREGGAPREGGREGGAPRRGGPPGGRGGKGQQFSLDDQKAFPALG